MQVMEMEEERAAAMLRSKNYHLPNHSCNLRPMWDRPPVNPHSQPCQMAAATSLLRPMLERVLLLLALMEPMDTVGAEVVISVRELIAKIVSDLHISAAFRCRL